ncbi:hypothetical protein T265_14964 [Opisthorchis viverrini]|uniref:Uncharacterized protein n=1 Tax=Opisthorchis viverrini TaxID=6198 RepID=A0A074Z4H4_OPIVI|nr:hypothetical protein T265_14964 [Opisthorchis viverrini]KER21996.1 hypothetical protein T265_14964 [Opisthorchis viverrini]
MRHHQCDALVVVPGQVAAFLLFDLFETHNQHIIRSKFEVDVFEDFIICIKKNEVHLYCNAVNHALLLPFTIHWPNLRVHCASESKMSNIDEYENYKITVFQMLVKDCKRLVVPCLDMCGAMGLHGFNNHYVYQGNEKFTKMMIEEWPIIQSYAFDTEHQCSREFFTLSRDIIDIPHELRLLVNRIDPVYLETTLVRALLSSMGTIESVYRLFDSFVESKQLSSRANPSEPLFSLYQHSAEIHGLLPPYLLYGLDSSKQNLIAKNIESKSSDLQMLTGSDHMVIRGYDQPSGIVCERTNFIQQPNNASHLTDRKLRSEKKLCQIYSKLLDILWKVTEAFNDADSDIDQTVSWAQNELKGQLQSESFSSLEIKLTYPWKNPTDAVTLAVLSGAVYDTEDIDGSSIGSVVAADTLLISTLRLNDICLSRKVISLTATIPPTCIWTRNPLPIDMTQFNSDKKPIFSEQLDIILAPANTPSSITVTCTCFEDYVIISGKRIGISQIELSNVLHYRPVDMEQPELLEFSLPSSCITRDVLTSALRCCILNGKRDGTLGELQKPTRIRGTETLRNGNNSANMSIWLMLKPKTKAKRLFLEQVAPVWRAKGLLRQSDCLPNRQAMRAAFIATVLSRDTQSVLSDLRGLSFSQLKFDSATEAGLYSLNQLMTEQPSAKAWLMIHQSELRHIEASWSLDNSVEGISSAYDYALCCGIHLESSNVPSSNAAWVDEIRSVILRNSEDKDISLLWTHSATNNESSPTGTQDNICREMRTKPLHLTVVCGTVGSRKDGVVKNVVDLVKEDTHWIQILPATPSDVSSALETAVKEYDSLLSSNAEARVRIRGILLCPGTCGARDVLKAVHRLSSNESTKQLVHCVRIGCVVTCVDTRAVFMDGGRMTVPGLLEMLSEGWTNYILSTGPPKSQQVAATKFGVKMEDVEALLHSVNPKLSQLPAPEGHVDRGHVLEALLDEEAFNRPGLKRARLLSYPSLNTTLGNPRMHAVTLRFARPVERVRFTNHLKAIFANLKPWPFYGNLYSVTGQIGFTGEPDKIYDVLHLTLNGISRISVNTDDSDLSRKRKANKPFWLTGILAAPPTTSKESDEWLSNQFANWLRKSGPQQEAIRPPLRLSDLSKADLEKIHEKYHLHPLPAGWYYTGSYYVNMNGDKSFQHPNFDAFVQEYLEGENTKIAARNARIVNHPIPDLFSEPS